MKSVFLLLISILLAFFNTASAQENSKDIRYWQNLPISISLKVGEERLIMLPFEANIHFHPTIVNKVSVSNLGTNILIKAQQAFEPGRIKIKSRDPSKSFLLIVDLYTTESASTEPVEIVIPDLLQNDMSDLNPPNSKSFDNEHPYSSLSRYVFQRLYMPERVWEGFSHISPAKAFSGFLPLYESGELRVKVLGSFRKGKYYATAVRATNITKKPVTVDVRKFRGDYKARAGHIFRLLPINVDADRASTAFVLFTDKPFDEAVGHALISTGVLSD